MVYLSKSSFLFEFIFFFPFGVFKVAPVPVGVVDLVGESSKICGELNDLSMFFRENLISLFFSIDGFV